MRDGATDPLGAGRCISGAETASQGGTYPWGDIVVCETQGTIEIRLSRPPEYPDGEVRLWHEIAEDSVARAGSDFEGGGGRVAWSSGDTEDKVFTLRILDDDEVEGDELIELQLSRYAGDGYWNSYGERMRVLIVDDDVDNASQPFLVANIDRGRTEGAQIRDKLALGATVYFAADDGRTGLELWRSDGSASGTALVRDLLPGMEGSGPASLTAAGDVLYFTARTEVHGGPTLFRTDGSPEGTVAVPGPAGPVTAEALVAHAGGLYFVRGNALWRATNGGSAEPVFEFRSPPQDLVVSQGVAYFTADDGVSGRELWRSDGSPAGTRLVADIIAGAEGSSPDNLIVLNGKILFDALQGPGLATRQFYVSDGTAAGTTGLGTFNYASSLTLGNAVVAEDRVFFTHFPVSYRGMLWVTDGSSEGTRQLREFRAVGSLTAIGREAYFSGDDDSLGHEPWKSDGTPEGTVLVADLNTTETQTTPLKSSNPRDFTAVGSRVYFTASASDSDRGLWRTDGTSEGTARVALGTAGPPSELVTLGAKLLLSAAHETAGEELWVMEADTERAELVRDINLVERGSAIDEITVFAERLMFTADDGTRGRELWLSDGTEGGTRLLHDLRPGELSSAPSELTVAGARVFFIAGGPGTGQGLWSSDGTESGVREIPLTSAALPRLGQLTAYGDEVLFQMNDESGRRALWRSDGTAAGTRRIAPEAGHVAVVGATIFMAIDGAEGRELWKSDGTAEGLELVRDVRPGSSGSNPERFAVAAGRLFFVAHGGAAGDGLWRSDGTAAGTVFLAELDRDSPVVPSGEAVYFLARGGLRRADGTSPSAESIHEGVRSFAAGDGELYFTVETEGYDLELWRSDGSRSGTRAVRSFPSGWLRDGLEQYAFVGGVFVFSASEGFLGKEIWRTDGTRLGTFRVSDLHPGPGDFAPKALTVLGGAVYFRAFTPQTGEELWGYRP